MILDSLTNAQIYHPLGGRFKTAFDYLLKFDPSTPDGRYKLDGDDLFALAQTYRPETPNERIFESHRQYADIQYVFSGQEVIFYSPSEIMRPKASYDFARDVTFYEDGDGGRPIHLQAGDFVVLWPQDGHKPGCLWECPGLVRKVVIKMRLLSS